MIYKGERYDSGESLEKKKHLTHFSQFLCRFNAHSDVQVLAAHGSSLQPSRTAAAAIEDCNEFWQLQRLRVSVLSHSA
jgi:hypothetical protein